MPTAASSTPTEDAERLICKCDEVDLIGGLGKTFHALKCYSLHMAAVGAGEKRGYL